IVEVAAKLFREKCYDGIGVADLMNVAGLTHGGFYGHFESKEDLLAEACNKAITHSLEQWRKRIERNPEDALGELARSYLNEVHRDNAGAGCVVASLGPDLARAGQPVQHALTAGVAAQLDMLAKALPGEPGEARRRAIASYAAMIGGLVLARALDDPELSKEVLAATVAQLEQA
ncbi:MAG TPA: TetR/AcrR family transcriptional regulator, partial [Pseudoduganella sp.]